VNGFTLETSYSPSKDPDSPGAVRNQIKIGYDDTNIIDITVPYDTQATPATTTSQFSFGLRPKVEQPQNKLKQDVNTYLNVVINICNIIKEGISADPLKIS
jgi:hypothetical protein